MRVTIGDHLGDGFAVSNLRSTDVDLDLVGTLKDIDFNIEVKFAHTFEDHLVRFFIGLNTERWIFLDHFTDSICKFFSICFVLWCDGDGDDRVRENHRFESGRVLFIAEGVTRLDVLETDDGDDVARLCGVDFVAVVGVHFNHAANAFGLAGEGVEHGITLLNRARVDAGEGESAELIVHDFEGKASKRCFGIDDGKLASLVALGVHFWKRFDVGRVRQIIDNRIEDEL